MLLRMSIVLLVLLSAGCEGNVVGITAATFDKTVKDHKIVVVSFFAPWCAHSKRFLPEYERVAQEMQGQVLMGNVDASIEANLVAKHASGYPTVRVFLNGRTDTSLEYKGEHKAEDLAVFVRRIATEEPVLNAGNKAQLDSIITAAKQRVSPTIAIGYFETSHSSELLAFTHAANTMRGVHYFIQADPSLSPKPAPYIHTLKDDVTSDFTAEFTASNVAKFVTDSSFPLFGEMQPGTVFESYAARDLPIVWLFVSGTDAASKAVMEETAGNFKGTLSVVWIDGVKYAPMMEQLGLRQGVFPAVAIENGAAHYAFTGKIAVPTITTWLAAFLEGKISRTVRSEPAPGSPVHRGLTTLVGSTTENVVGGKKNVLLFMHAPWCSHCQAMTPAYKEVAKAYAADTSITIAMLDATANDVPEWYQMDGYPTIIFVPAGSRDVRRFTGARSLQGITGFIKKSTGVAVEEDEDEDEDEEL